MAMARHSRASHGPLGERSLPSGVLVTATATRHRQGGAQATQQEGRFAGRAPTHDVAGAARIFADASRATGDDRAVGAGADAVGTTEGDATGDGGVDAGHAARRGGAAVAHLASTVDASLAGRAVDARARIHASAAVTALAGRARHVHALRVRAAAVIAALEAVLAAATLAVGDAQAALAH